VMDRKDVTLICGDELAKLHGYSEVTSQCRAWWRALGIKPLPGRRNIYDPRQVRDRLNEVGGLDCTEANKPTSEVSLTEQRRARKRAQ
jgi:hypothetical protein